MPDRPWDATAAALLLEQRTARDVAGLTLPSPETCFRDLRDYLVGMSHRRRIRPYSLLKQRRSAEELAIEAGPQIFRAPCADCIQFASGALLSFGVTLSAANGQSELLACRFHLQLPSTAGLEFIRIDLDPASGSVDPLRKPRSHLHPGFDVHVPFPVLQPLEALDRIFEVIEPAFAR